MDGRVNAVGMKVLGKEDKCLGKYQASELQSLRHMFAGEHILAFTWKTRGNSR